MLQIYKSVKSFWYTDTKNIYITENNIQNKRVFQMKQFTS